jgi:hypothetical protein
VSRTERGRVQVAEQVCVARAPGVVVDALERPSSWIQPFCVLGWNQADLAARRGGTATSTRSTGEQHKVTVRLARRGVDGSASFAFRWHVPGASELFERLDGTMSVRALGNLSTLAVEASYEPIGPVDGSERPFRPAELAVRTMLGRVRSAIEDTTTP